MGLLTSASVASHSAALTSALFSVDEQLAADALQTLCGSQKQTEPASALEMQLHRAFWPMRIKGASPHARKQLVTSMRRWLQRLKRSTFGSARDRRELAQLEADAAAGRPLREKLEAAASKLEYARGVGAWLTWLVSE